MKHLKLESLLAENAYPGRGICLGKSEDGLHAVAVYFIMGRSENSRNRVFVETEDGIRTQAHDPAKLTDPRLIIYHPVRVVNKVMIVTNGDQTDTIEHALRQGKSFQAALRTRSFEPDAPNFTPRISGVLKRKKADCSYRLSILKCGDQQGGAPVRYFYEYPQALAGVGHFIHTYQQDGDPLPSFQGEPLAVAIPNDVQTFAKSIWSSLNEQNRVSLFVRYVRISDGDVSTYIINRHE